MTTGRRRIDLDRLVVAAERFDSYADTAELMGDDAGADRFRADAADSRMLAMRLLDTGDQRAASS